MGWLGWAPWPQGVFGEWTHEWGLILCLCVWLSASNMNNKRGGTLCYFVFVFPESYFYKKKLYKANSSEAPYRPWDHSYILVVRPSRSRKKFSVKEPKSPCIGLWLPGRVLHVGSCPQWQLRGRIRMRLGWLMRCLLGKICLCERERQKSKNSIFWLILQMFFLSTSTSLVSSSHELAMS